MCGLQDDKREKEASEVKMRESAAQGSQSQPQRKRKRKNKHKDKSSPNPLSATAPIETVISNSSPSPSQYALNSRIPKPEQRGEGFSFGELIQRSVSGGGFHDSDSYGKVGSSVEIENQRKGSTCGPLESLDLDLKRVLPQDSNLKSPVTYFLEQVYNGNSLRSTTTQGNLKGRERVYDTIFRLPWRCELLKTLASLPASIHFCHY